MVRRSSTENFERIEHLTDRITLVQADLLDQPSLIEALEEARPAELYNLGAQSFVPTSWKQPVLTAEFTAVGVTRCSRRSARVDPDDPLLPGLVLGDVRQGARGPAERDDAVLPALALRRGQGLRALHHRQLPRVVRALRGLRHPLQPRVAAAGARVRDAQDLGRRRAHQARPRRRAAARKPRREARLGLRRRLRRGDVADAPAGRARGLRDRDRGGALGPRVRRDRLRPRRARPGAVREDRPRVPAPGRGRPSGRGRVEGAREARLGAARLVRSSSR